jgi:membrane associated rhomboid family serine protease
VFVVQLFARGTNFDLLFGLSREFLFKGCVWQLVTFQFLHGTPLHVIVNLVALHFLMRPLERIFGPRFVISLWLAAGLLGGLAECMLSEGVIVGASATGFAALLLYTTIYPWAQILIFPIPFPLKAKYVGWGALISSAVFVVFDLMPGIGHGAHLAGGLLGFMLGRKLRGRAPFIMP